MKISCFASKSGDFEEQRILRLFQNNSAEGDTIKVSRNDLAVLSGTASETVSRTLTEFKNEGLIEKKGSSLTILNHKKISELKN